MATARDPFQDGDRFLQHFLAGNSPRVRALRGLVYRLNVAHKNKRMIPSILLRGERGVGKGFTAHVIAAHLRSLVTSKGEDLAPPADADVYQLAVSAGLRSQTLTALPETLAEAILFGSLKGAYTGATDRQGLFEADVLVDVFLDEVGDAPPEVQGKLLEVLETRRFRRLGLGFDKPDLETEARVIAATNRNLRRLVDNGKFRADLYDRLMWMPIDLPPLREQLDQLPDIIARMNAELRRRYRLDDIGPAPSDIECCRRYAWPGNHRELLQVLWEWHLFEGSVPLKSIIEARAASAGPQNAFNATVLQLLFSRFDAILEGGAPGFKYYGDIVDEMRQLAYKALWLFNRDRRLKDEDLTRLFADQPPVNVRKQISDNRPKGPERE
jgi:DNA-binding NtrC family response regulator